MLLTMHFLVTHYFYVTASDSPSKTASTKSQHTKIWEYSAKLAVKAEDFSESDSNAILSCWLEAEVSISIRFFNILYYLYLQNIRI